MPILEEGGILTLDRDLPFLIVYREPADRPDPGTARLVATEAAFLSRRRVARNVPPAGAMAVIGVSKHINASGGPVRAFAFFS